VRSFPKKYRFIKKKVSLTILLSNNKNIKKLNKRFRNKNKSTDVLSFPSEKKLNIKKTAYIGDIVISYEFMNKPKILTTLEFKRKVIKILIHGFLHLLGYDHIKLKDFKKMLFEEEKIYKIVKTKIAELA
jgi:probable rRNA maturation factor